MKFSKTAVYFAVLMSLSSAAYAEECHDALLSIERTETKGNPVFRVAIADEPLEMMQGLMNVKNMPDDTGMLFVYPSEGQVSFWMKNTLIPLDMIFITSDGSVSKIHENAVPHDLTPITSDSKVKYVLEVNGGLSKSLNLSVGDTVVSPVIGTGCADHTDVVLP
jgi:uncharacterized membrane protein (UPF0127 family)